MAKSKKKKKVNRAELSSALLYLLVGLTLVIFRTQAIGLAMTLAGVFFIVSGVLELFYGNTVGGAVSLVIGIAIIVLGWTLMEIVLLVLGILIAVKGLLALNDELRRKKQSLPSILFAILTVLFGLLLAFGNGFDIILLLVGIFLLANGILGVVAALK